MPSIFKSLASMAAGVFIAMGWWQILVGGWGYLNSEPNGTTPVPPSTLGAWAIWASGVMFLVLGAVTTRLRRMLE